MRDESERQHRRREGVGSPIFQVSNKHPAACGEPPRVEGDTQGRYHGYYENEYGEQAIFVYESETCTGTLWMGDAGWAQARRVIDGRVADLVLGESERLWLQACWHAATGGRRDSAG